MPDNLKKVGAAPQHDLCIADADDIVIVVPEPGYKDTPEVSRVVIEALREYASKLGKKCGLVIVANNLLAQEAESRRLYAERLTPDLFFGVTLVVSSPLPRVIGNVALRFTNMQFPFTLSDSIEAGIAWIKTLPRSA